MAESLRARDAFIEAHVDLFHYVIEISARTAVPSMPPALDVRELVPCYNPRRRELSVAGIVCKRLVRPARNQEKVLMACQEDDWQGCIDDPLPGGSADPVKRLHDTLDALNEYHDTADPPPYHVHFSSDGTGQGIRWKIVAMRAARHRQPAVTAA